MRAEQRWDLLFESKGEHVNAGECPCPRLHNVREEISPFYGYGIVCTPYLNAKIEEGPRKL